MKRVKAWRQDARARGIVIGPRKHRYPAKRARGNRVPERFKDHWPEMLKCLEERPDQTAPELLVEFQARYPGVYKASHLRTLRRRLKAWRHEAIQRLICEIQDHTQDTGSGTTAR